MNASIRTVYVLLSLSVCGAAQVGGAGFVSEVVELSDCTLGDNTGIQGNSCAGIGDLDGDGIADLATQSAFEQDAVAIHFLTAEGTIRESALFGQGGLGFFVGDIAELEGFSDEMAALGDLDLDGIPDMLVGHDMDDDGPGNPGAAWVVFLNSNGTVKNQAKISALVGGLTMPPKNNNSFGRGLATIGDLNGDGIQDIAVSAPGAGQISSSGVVHILMMNRDGTVQSQTTLGMTGTPLGEALPTVGAFGESITSLGDLDGDGVPDLAVGMIGGVNSVGSAWILFLTPAGAVKDFACITEGTPGFGGDLSINGDFGREVDCIGDLNGDSWPDIAVCESSGDLTGTDQGVIYILFLGPAGEVLGWNLFTEGLGGFDGELRDSSSALGYSMDVLSGGDGLEPVVLAIGANVECPFYEPAQFLVTLDDGQRAISYGYGDAINPAGSLQVLSGTPSLGSTMQVGIDNPLGTQSPGAFPFLALSLQPDLNFPNGTSLPGFGMAGSGAPGEVLISLSGADIIPMALFGESWQGAGQPSSVDIFIPFDTSLQGLNIFCQGVVPDPIAPPTGVRLGFTEGLQLRIGP